MEAEGLGGRDDKEEILMVEIQGMKAGLEMDVLMAKWMGWEYSIDDRHGVLVGHPFRRFAPSTDVLAAMGEVVEKLLADEWLISIIFPATGCIVRMYPSAESRGATASVPHANQYCLAICKAALMAAEEAG